MAARILPFSIPDSTELSTWLEEHVAAPTLQPTWAGSRLLDLSGCTPKNPANIEEGIIVWNRFSGRSPAREGSAVELRYTIRPTARPQWGGEGQWFAMCLHRPDGSLLAEIPLRGRSFDHCPEMYCPNCHTQKSADLLEGPCVNEDTGEAHCYNCAEDLWPEMRAAYERGNWSKVKCTRIVLDGREREKKRVAKSRVAAQAISLSFFERHPSVVNLPRAYKVFNRSIQQSALGHFIADPGLMPIVESAVTVIAQ